MPIQFTCSHCRRTLSVTRRKAGMSVACPKCGQATLVPQTPGILSDVSPVLSAPGQFKAPIDAAGPAAADSTVLTIPPVPGTTTPAVFQPLVSEIGAFDDIPALIGEPETVGATRSEPVPPPTPPPIPPALPTEAVGDFPFIESAAPAANRPESTRLAGARLPSTRRGRQPDGQVLLVTRQAVYAQAGLMAGLLIVAFLAGLLVGRGQRPEASAQTQKKVSAEPVALGGHVLYSLSPGDSLPDEGSVVIALPADKKPDVRITASGHDETDPDSEAALAEIGAVMARGDASGEFQLVVPRPGNYLLLMISSHANRPDDAALPTADGTELSKYFASPGKLIGQKRYALISRRLAGAPPPLTHEFGPTDKR